MTNVWDSLTVFWALPKGLYHFSSSALCSTHSLSSRLLLAAFLPTAAVLGGHPMVLAVFSFNWAALSAMASHWALFIVPNLNFSPYPFQLWGFNCYWGRTVSNGLSWPLTVPNLSCFSWPLHAFETSTTWTTLRLLSSAISMRYKSGHLWNTTSLCRYWGNTAQISFTSMMLVSS